MSAVRFRTAGPSTLIEGLVAVSCLDGLIASERAWFGGPALIGLAAVPVASPSNFSHPSQRRSVPSDSEGGWGRAATGGDAALTRRRLPPPPARRGCLPHEDARCPELAGIPVGLLLLLHTAELVVKATLAVAILAFSAYCLASKAPLELKDDRLAWVAVRQPTHEGQLLPRRRSCLPAVDRGPAVAAGSVEVAGWMIK
jgi:hypothetical protein